MRFSDGVNKYHDEKKKSILNSVLNSAQSLPSGAEDREGFIMSTNKRNTGAAVKTNKGGIIAAALAILMLGGAAAFFAFGSKGSSTEIKTAPGAQPGVSAVINQNSTTDESRTEDSKTEDSSEVSDPGAPVTKDGDYLTASPAAVIAPDDKGTVNEGFEGYNIEVKYLLEDPWKGIDNLAQHTYGIVIDVSAKEGYELPWADEEAKVFSHLGEVWIGNGHSYNMGYFDVIKPNKVTACGYKTLNEKGEEILRFMLVAYVDDDFEIGKDTRISFNVTEIFWGVGDNIRISGNFSASETFDKARTLDLSLTVPYRSESADETEE